MIVCLCQGVTDRTIRKLVQEGASSLYQVGLACSAGAWCGGCRGTLIQILEADKPTQHRPLRKLATAS